MKTVKYVRKPLFVDAIKVTDENFNDLADWCDGTIVYNTDPDGYDYIRVRVVNPKSPRQTKAYVGDWLLYTDRGYKVYTDRAFKKQFDRAEAESDFLDDDEDEIEDNPDQPTTDVELPSGRVKTVTLPEGYGQGEEA